MCLLSSSPDSESQWSDPLSVPPVEVGAPPQQQLDDVLAVAQDGGVQTGEVTGGELSALSTVSVFTNLGGKLSLTSSPMLSLTSTSPTLPEVTASCRLRDIRRTDSHGSVGQEESWQD